MAGMEIDHLHTSGVSDTALQAHISRISAYRDQLKEVMKEEGYNSPESLISLLDDTDLQESIAELRSDLGGDTLTDVVVVGMGGSARGSRAVFDLIGDETSTKLHTIDSVDSVSIRNLLHGLRQRRPQINEIAVCVISKSGSTTETLANTNILLGKLGEVFSVESILGRTVVVTQPGTELSSQAKQQGMKTIFIPEQISGRFSVFSAAGLLPLSLLGVNTESLVEGAKTLRNVCLSGRPISDPAAAVASILYTHMQESTRILNHYFFTPRASAFGSWTRQLYAESLGKRTNSRGEPVFSGIYPVTSIAPRDLHADFQLQLGGPKNFFTIFVREQDAYADLEEIITDAGLLPEKLSYLKGQKLGDLHKALQESTVETFRDDGRPYIDIRIPRFDTLRVGQLLMLEELVVMYLGHFLEINTFNQPQVEKYKDIARAKMEKN